MTTFRKATMAMLAGALPAGQANAESLADTGLPYTYTYAAGTTISGPGAADEEVNPFVLNDGFFTSQADIDADAGAVGGYYVNGGQNNGVIFGTGAGNNRRITVDLGSVQDLRLVDMYYSVHGPFAVDAPWQVDVTVDGSPPLSFNPFDITPTVRTGAPPTGDARMSTIDLTGLAGQIITLDFYSDGRTDLAGGGSQSGAFGGEWTSMNEIVFNPERVTPGPVGVTPYNEAVLADSPAYYWTFDEEGIVNAVEQVQGLPADEFVPGANAAKVESATTGGGVSLGQAARIEGSGGFTWNVADLSGTGMSGAWAYEFWANADDITTYEYMIGSNAAGGFNNETILKWGPGGEPAGMQLYNGGGVLNPVAVPMTAGWHHYVFVSDGATGDYDLYLDGAFVAALTNGTSHGPHPEVALKLGGWTDGASAEVFDGLLDELAIYDLSGAGDLDAAGQKIADHYFASGKALRAQFSYDGGSGMLTVAWESRDGRLYNLRSEADLSAGDPVTWPIFGGNQDLEATPPENSLTFPLPAEAARFFVVEEFPAPPVSVFSDDFESGQGGWTTGGEPGADPSTNWELGSPSSVGPASANSGANCFATNLSADYGNDVDIWLHSPAIDLTTAVGATLKFSHYVDIEEAFDSGEVRLLDADDANAELTVLQMAIDGNNPTGWQSFSKSLPPAALGKNVVIEFRFLTDNFNGGPQAGWYLDDVSVTVP